MDSLGVDLEESFGMTDSSVDDESSDETEGLEVEVENNITRHQYEISQQTCLTDNAPEAKVQYVKESVQKKQQPKPKDSTPIAPAEGKFPTNLMRANDWDISSFPCLHPSGQFGLHHKRPISLSPQQYFVARILNKDSRWRRNLAYLFSAVYFIERAALERSAGICCQRGKLQDGNFTQLEDAFHVFDKIPGTPNFWRHKRFEILSKLERYGGFTFFFTLSSAEKRWSEVFVSILKQRSLRILYKRQRKVKKNKENTHTEDDIFVIDENEKEVPLDEYLKQFNKHELIKENVLTLTMVFNKRVQSFIKNILMGRGSTFNVNFYQYRVEFQMRGAAHIHGVLWVDLEQLEKTLGLPNLQSIMNKLRVTHQLDQEELTTLAQFVDHFVTASSSDETVADIVKEVQTHVHTKSCTKKGKFCRFHFPKFPSDKTVIAIPFNRADFKTEAEYLSLKKKYKNTLSKVKEVLEELPRSDLSHYSIKDVLSKAGVTEGEYYQALQVSERGAIVILKRNVEDIFVNNYNREILLAWNGNCDFQVCLDFFAISTYITDYFLKTESALTNILKEAAMACKSMEKKDQMHLMADTFLSHRQLGESEALYRIIPSLHLSHSNIKCVFVPTGFEYDRSRFLRKVDENDTNDTHESEENFTVGQRKGKYVPVASIHEKYAKRPDSLEHMTLAQFATSYDRIGNHAGKAKLSGGIASPLSDQTVVSHNKKLQVKLPIFIKLKEQEYYMKLRGTPSVMRIHKVKEEYNPHEFFYSELLLYRPWRDEKELHPECLEACMQLYKEECDCDEHMDGTAIPPKVEKVKDKLFPFKNNVEEARAMMENMPSERAEHVGDNLDPELEHENEDQEAEGFVEETDYAARNPDQLPTDKTSATNPERQSVYKRIDISNLDAMLASTRQLDEDQGIVFRKLIDYVKNVRASEKWKCAPPSPPLLVMHAPGGCGKSKVINDIASWTEYYMSLGKDKDPNKPACLKLAPTGKAANVIDGNTLHSGLRLDFKGALKSLSEMTRDSLRKSLEHVTVVIIDELSMIKADMLYQIYSRLQELKQQPSAPFGGVAVLLSGDLQQLGPVMGRFIFEEPYQEQYSNRFKIDSLWHMFQFISLSRNHRQGEDKTYGDMLNRIRVGEKTDEDITMLTARVGRKHPKDAIYLFGKTIDVKEHNSVKLEELPGQVETIDAINIHPFQTGYEPILGKNGQVNNTPFQKTLHLKENARVMLTYNVDVADSLSNGTTGRVLQFIRNKKGEISHIGVLFDDPKCGSNLREKMSHMKHKLVDPLVTLIGKCSFQYQLGKSDRHDSTKAKVIQFPLTLAFAYTVHKAQGCQ